MLKKSKIIAAYDLFLDRAPESEDVINYHMNAPSVEFLINSFIISEEFLKKNPNMNARNNSWVWTDVYDNFTLRVNLADKHVSMNIIKGSFELPETNFVKKTVKPGMHVLDIGANLGYFTMLMATLVGSSGRIDSFEPLPFLNQSLSKSVVKNGFDEIVYIHEFALGKELGEVGLVYAPNSDNWGGAYLAFDNLIPAGHTAHKVAVKPLAEAILDRKFDFIKIDVEGAEPLVLESAADLLISYKPIILSEVHPSQLYKVCGKTGEDYVKFLEKCGYSCYELLGDGNLGLKVQSNQANRFFNAVMLPD